MASGVYKIRHGCKDLQGIIPVAVPCQVKVSLSDKDSKLRDQIE